VPQLPHSYRAPTTFMSLNSSPSTQYGKPTRYLVTCISDGQARPRGLRRCLFKRRWMVWWHSEPYLRAAAGSTMLASRRGDE
jgi:hypothetical protein